MGNYVCDMYDWQKVSDINTKIAFTYKWEKEPNMNMDTLHQKRNTDTNGQWIYKKKIFVFLNIKEIQGVSPILEKKVKEWDFSYTRKKMEGQHPSKALEICCILCMCVCLCVFVRVYMHTCTYKIFEQSQEDNFKQKYTFIDILTSLNT